MYPFEQESSDSDDDDGFETGFEIEVADFMVSANDSPQSKAFTLATKLAKVRQQRQIKQQEQRMQATQKAVRVDDLDFFEMTAMRNKKLLAELLDYDMGATIPTTLDGSDQPMTKPHGFGLNPMSRDVNTSERVTKDVADSIGHWLEVSKNLG